MAVLACRAEQVSLVVLQSTDIHGSGAIANLAAWIEQERQADPELLVVDCGDLSRGSFAASVDGGASMVSVLNACRYDAWVPGNHEFRIGAKAFRRNLDRFTAGAVLAANLKFDDPAAAPKRPVLPWKLFERRGLKIAIIGLTSSYYDDWFSPVPYAGLNLLSPAEVLPPLIAEIRQAGADLVFVAAHLGAAVPVETETGKETFIPFAEAIKRHPEISLLLAGHTHQTAPATELHPGTWVVQPPTHAKGIAKITIVYDTVARRTVNVTSEFLKAGEISPRADMPADWVANNQQAEVQKTNVLARLPAGMSLGPAEKGKASSLAVMIARAMAEATGAEAAVSRTYSHWRNQGRELTALDFHTMMPNEYSITLLTLKPEQLSAVLQEMGGVAGRSFGLDGERLSDQPVTVAFDAYDVQGCDGAYPVLRTTARSGTVNRRDLDLTVREALRSLLMRLYPAN